MTASVRWGILSTAQIAQDELLPAFMDASNAEVVAIASSNTKVKDIALKFGIPKVYETYEDLLRDPEVDAVYIPLPNALHSQWVKRAAENGKHVLCEKPAALTASEAEEMIEVCKKERCSFYGSLYVSISSAASKSTGDYCFRRNRRAENYEGKSFVLSR